jgi:hypothetical protein
MCKRDERCCRPDKAKLHPEKCSAEQIRECHGDKEPHPCTPAGECEKPEKLKIKPTECSPEQIRECHGDAASHPCERTDNKT